MTNRNERAPGQRIPGANRRTNPTNRQRKSDEGAAEDLGGLAVGEFLAEDGHPVGIGGLGFGTEFDLDLRVHHAGRLGEVEVADGLRSGLADLDADTLGEGTKLITSHRLQGAEGGGLKDVSGAGRVCVCFHLLGTIYWEMSGNARDFLKNFLKSRDPEMQGNSSTINAMSSSGRFGEVQCNSSAINGLRFGDWVR